MGTREAESVPADSAFKLDDLEAEYDLYKANEQLEDNEVTVNGSEDDYGNKKGIDLDTMDHQVPRRLVEIFQVSKSLQCL